jgi:serine/threonine protein kinase
MPQVSDTDLLLDGPYSQGDVVDARYKLVRPLGEGGMGMVWVAHDQLLEVHVALKLMAIRHRGQRQETLAARLLQEARAAARLGHPAICRVLNFGTTQFGDPYIATELLDGEPLADFMSRVQRMSAVDAIRTLLPIMDALASAHARGIVHRDVKPENIFLAKGDSGRPQPKLLDFGIARVVDGGSKITLEGSLLGTPDYMSPEQARGKTDTDGRTDVWSTCVVFYEMMTGQVPFAGENYNGVLWSVMNEEPTPLPQHGAGDEALWTLLARGLQKDPDARWQSMRDFGMELAKWLYDRGVLEDVCGASLRTTWIEASFSGDRPSMVSSLPPGSGGPPTLPGEDSKRPPFSSRSHVPRSASWTPGSSDLVAGQAGGGPLSTPAARGRTDSRVSFSSQHQTRRTVAGLDSRVWMGIAAAALLIAVGGTVVYVGSGNEAAATAPVGGQASPAAAERPAELATGKSKEPKVSPVESAAEPKPQPSAESATSAVVAQPAAPEVAAPVAPPPQQAAAPPPAEAAPAPAPAPPAPAKKSDDYALGF